jgi:hypothetical protein
LEYLDLLLDSIILTPYDYSILWIGWFSEFASRHCSLNANEFIIENDFYKNGIDIKTLPSFSTVILINPFSDRELVHSSISSIVIWQDLIISSFDII